VLLLDGGDSADSKGEDGVNSLHIAAKNRNIAENETATGLLLHHGAKVDNQDKYGKTALHFAIEAGNLTAVGNILKCFLIIKNPCMKAV